MLYQTFRVCDSCHVLCKALRELKTAELKIAKSFGVPQIDGLDDIVEQPQLSGAFNKKTNMVNNVWFSTKERSQPYGWDNPLNTCKELSIGRYHFSNF